MPWISTTEKWSLMFRTTLAATALLASTLAPAFADFPREGVAGIPNGVSTPFEGAWQMGFPDGEDVIVSELVVTCDAPAVIRGDGEQAIVYRSPQGSEARFELTEFSNRTSWLPEAGESMLAVWTSADEFFSYRVDAATGKAAWDDPRVYRRCP